MKDNMTQTLVKLGEHEDRVLTIIKGKYGLKNKSDAVNFVIGRYEQDILEPELRPEYLAKIGRIKKQKGMRFRGIASLRRSIEHA
ncbi:MAG TPA: antitoxin [Candidatus Nanoarchaeia archaeon]|nr:antitoxin [Candidatus Nanoarchaeia archaeon]